jgi:hypothetical protein
MIIYFYFTQINKNIYKNQYGDWGLGIGDWGLIPFSRA